MDFNVFCSSSVFTLLDLQPRYMNLNWKVTALPVPKYEMTKKREWDTAVVLILRSWKSSLPTPATLVEKIQCSMSSSWCWVLLLCDVIKQNKLELHGKHWLKDRTKIKQLIYLVPFVFCNPSTACIFGTNWLMSMVSVVDGSQQNSYSISYLLGTVTTQWLPLWRCSHCSLVPNTVTTLDTHVIR